MSASNRGRTRAALTIDGDHQPRFGTDLVHIRAVADLLPHLAWSCRSDGYCDYLSRRWVEYTGVPEELHHGQGWLTAVHPEDCDRTRSTWTAFISGNDEYDVDYRLRHHDGSFRWFKTRGTLVFDAQGRPSRVFGTTIDIDDQKRIEHELKKAEEELRTREMMFREVADIAPVALWLTDRNGICTFLSREWYELTGQTEAEALGMGWTEATHPDDRERAGREFLNASAAREPFRTEYRLRVRDGSYRWAIDSGRARFSRDGAFLGMVGAVFDIEERRRAEDQLRVWADRQRFFAELTTATQPLNDPDAVTGVIARMVGEQLFVDRCAYAEVDDEETYVFTGEYVRDVPSIVGRRPISSFGSDHSRMMRDDQPYVINDVRADPRIGPDRQSLYRDIDTKAAIFVPLCKSGRLTAALTLHQKSPRHWTADDVDLVRTVAVRCWETIERARANRALQASELRFRSVFESMDDGFCLIEPIFDVDEQPIDYRYLMTNPALEAHTGLKDIVGRTARELMPNHESYWIEAYARVARCGEVFRHEGRVQDLGRWYEVVAFRVGDPAMGQVGVLFKDVTDRQRAAEALRASERQLSDIFNHAPSFMAVLRGPDHVFERMNDRYSELVSGRAVVGRTVREALPEVVGQGFIDLLDNVYRTGEPYIGAGTRVTLDVDGRERRIERYLDFVYQPLRDADGAVSGILVQGIDLTERRRVEEQLKEEEERAAFVRRASGVGFWYCDLPFDALEWDELVKVHFHLPRDARVTIDTFYERIHPDDRESTRKAIERSISEHSSYDVHYRTTHPETGAEKWIRAIGRTSYDHAGNPIRFDGVTLDVTTQKRTEFAAAEALRRLDSALIAGEVGTFEWDVLSDRLHGDANFARIFGLELDDSGGAPLAVYVEAIHPEDRAKVVELVSRTVETGVDYKAEYRIVSGGTTRWIVARGKATRESPDGPVTRFPGVVLDITERKRAEEALKEADVKKDEFLALLAHELRNPLAPLRNGLQVLRLAGANSELSDRARAMMDRQLSHMVRLVDDLLDISRISRGKLTLRRERLLVADVVSNAVETARPVIDAAKHELEISLPEEPIYLDADLTRLAQVFSNLLTNAAKYTPPGGRIGLAVETSNGHVVVNVRDSGIGIPAGSLSTIFDMFSQVDRSVERTSGGLGIGLALVKGLVEMHNGTVSAASDGPGAGSLFTVVLSLSQELQPSPDAAEGAESPVSRGPSRRVLVVDDNRDSAESMASTLELLGHQVRMAHDGNDAVEIAEEFHPEVILMDVGMPRMNGYEATRQLRSRSWAAGTSIIALTGWGQDSDREQSQQAGCDGHLVKPVRLEELTPFLVRSAK